MRKILVSGASSGIGWATVAMLALGDAEILATGRRTVAPHGWPQSATIRYLSGDVTEPRFIDALAEEGRDVDVLVNAAGLLKHAPFLQSSPADWRRVFDTNVLSVMALSQGIARHMAARHRGQIIMLSSTFAHQSPPPCTFAYAASKHAVRALSDGLRVELAPYGIRICEVVPGYTETGIRRHIDDPEVLRTHDAKNPPALKATDVATAIAFAIANPVTDMIVVRPGMGSKQGM